MSKDEILLSEKHGVNPALDCCFYCGKEVGIILCGKLKNDEKAPMHVCSSVEPCDECKEKYKDCCLIVEKEPEGEPTGRWIAIPKEHIVEEMRDNSVMFTTIDTFNQIVCQCKKEGN